MKVPLSWLKTLVAVDAAADTIADKLTFSGIEVEGIAQVGSDYTGLVVAEVRAVKPHPNADRLTLCRVFDGAAEVDVVCGAPNVKPGMRVPFAPAGTVLPGGQRIKASKIRGEASGGMLCAEDELGLSDRHDGLMELPADVRPGTPLAELLGGPDTVLELEITWNRPDCLSMIGVAREIGALFGVPLRLPSAEPVESGDAATAYVSVSVEAPALCNRYTARYLDGIAIGASPFWMQNRLRLCGIRPISNVVDVTNYVLLECGHPLHAFDADLLEGGITVRCAGPGERMRTLDDIERELTGEMLVIADAAGPVAIAGIMGGARSEIRAATTRVVLESAHFAPPSIRHTGSALKLASESSRRFERGVNVMTVDWASARAAALLQEIAGARLATGLVDVFSVRPVERRIALDYGRMEALLGITLPADTVTSIFESLDCPVTGRRADGCTVQVPAFRHDLEIEADLIEEVARMHGLEHVPEAPPVARVAEGRHDEEARALVRCRDILVGLGLTEIMTYSFLSPTLLDAVNPDDAPLRVALPNPVSADHAMLRPSLIPQMVETLGRNLARQTAAMAAFEIGRVFRRGSGEAISERPCLSVGLMGDAGAPTTVGRRMPDAAMLFLRMKGLLEALFEAVHLAGIVWVPAERTFMEDGFGAEIRCGESVLGHAGILADAVAHKWRLNGPVAVAELDATALLGRVFAFDGLQACSPFPAVARDVALVVDRSVTHAAIEQVMRAAAPPELTAINLFDIFSSETIGAEKLSLAYTLVYQSDVRTLTDAEVNGFHERVRSALTDSLGAELR